MVDGDRCSLIDWPQWVETGHPNAGETLERDVRVLLHHFTRKYGIERSLAGTIAEVTG
jgi:RIO kinase 2